MTKPGTVLRELRREAHMTQAELARAVGVFQSAIQQIEAGGNMRGSTAHRIARVLELRGFDFAEVLERLTRPQKEE